MMTPEEDWGKMGRMVAREEQDKALRRQDERRAALRAFTDKIWKAILEAKEWDESKRRWEDSTLFDIASEFCLSSDGVTMNDLREDWEKHLPSFKKWLAPLSHIK